MLRGQQRVCGLPEDLETSRSGGLGRAGGGGVGSGVSSLCLRQGEGLTTPNIPARLLSPEKH